VAEFVNSGMRRSEFCQSRGLSFSTLDRHLKKRRGKRQMRSAPADGKLVAVELAKGKFRPARSNNPIASTANDNHQRKYPIPRSDIQPSGLRRIYHVN
jgi:hypothetical protein